MTVREMIVKGRLLLQQINSNIFASITDEEWCDVLNMTIEEFVRKRSFDPKDSNRDNYELINYSVGLQSLIRTHKFQFPKDYLNFTDGYYGNLLSLDNIQGQGYISHIPIQSGLLYRIVKLYGADDFKVVGANANEEGELFIAYFNASVNPTLSTPAVLLYNTDVYITHSTTNLKAGITYSVLKGTVTFPIGYSLKVTVNGVDYWLTGTSQNRISNMVLSTGDTFVIHATYSAQWSNYSILEEKVNNGGFFEYISSKSNIVYICNGKTNIRRDVPNRFTKVKDIEHIRLESRGAVISSPICMLHNNNIVVFGNSSLTHLEESRRYTIQDIILTYYKKPNVVSVSANVNCDLDEAVHSEIVRKAVDTLNATTEGANYQAMKTETLQNTQQK